MKEILILLLVGIIKSAITQNETSQNNSESTEVPTNDTNNDDYYMKNEDPFTAEWRSKMYDYESTYVYMIPVAYKSSQIFYENITTVPARVRGAFIIDESSKDKVDFQIKGPKGNVVYSNVTHACVFDFTIEEKGLYQIEFNNRYKNGEVKPTFTMNTGQNVILKKEDLSHTEKNLDQLISFLKNYGTEDKLKRNIHRERYQKIVKTNRYFYTFSVIETIVLIIVSVWQFYYMKHLFEIKGSL